LGGSGTNDAGAGMLAALAGLPPGTAWAGGGGALGDVVEDDLADALRVVRALTRGVELLAAVDVDVPLLGLTGASAGFAEQKGATPAQAQALEGALAHFARTAVAALGDLERPDLLAGPRGAHGAHGPHGPGRGAFARLTSAAGAGAAGGAGFGLLVAGGRLVPGAALVADAVGLDALAADSDVVVTGEGRFDWQSLHGKVVATVAGRALAAAVPTVVVAGQVEVGRREYAAAGITSAYAVGETPAEVAAALADPVGSLARRVERVARTWSR